MLRSYLFVLLCTYCRGEEDSVEGKYIDLLPESEKIEFINSVARKIFDETKSFKRHGLHLLTDGSIELSNSQLDQHSDFVNKLMREEKENLERKNGKLKTKDFEEGDAGKEEKQDHNKNLEYKSSKLETKDAAISEAEKGEKQEQRHSQNQNLTDNHSKVGDDQSKLETKDAENSKDEKGKRQGLKPNHNKNLDMFAFEGSSASKTMNIDTKDREANSPYIDFTLRHSEGKISKFDKYNLNDKLINRIKRNNANIDTEIVTVKRNGTKSKEVNSEKSTSDLVSENTTAVSKNNSDSINKTISKIITVADSESDKYKPVINKPIDPAKGGIVPVVVIMDKPDNSIIYKTRRVSGPNGSNVNNSFNLETIKTLDNATIKSKVHNVAHKRKAKKGIRKFRTTTENYNDSLVSGSTTTESSNKDSTHKLKTNHGNDDSKVSKTEGEQEDEIPEIQTKKEEPRTTTTSSSDEAPANKPKTVEPSNGTEDSEVSKDNKDDSDNDGNKTQSQNGDVYGKQTQNGTTTTESSNEASTNNQKTNNGNDDSKLSKTEEDQADKVYESQTKNEEPRTTTTASSDEASSSKSKTVKPGRDTDDSGVLRDGDDSDNDDNKPRSGNEKERTTTTENNSVSITKEPEKYNSNNLEKTTIANDEEKADKEIQTENSKLGKVDLENSGKFETTTSNADESTKVSKSSNDEDDQSNDGIDANTEIGNLKKVITENSKESSSKVPVSIHTNSTKNATVIKKQDETEHEEGKPTNLNHSSEGSISRSTTDKSENVSVVSKIIKYEEDQNDDSAETQTDVGKAKITKEKNSENLSTESKDHSDNTKDNGNAKNESEHEDNTKNYHEVFTTETNKPIATTIKYSETSNNTQENNNKSINKQTTKEPENHENSKEHDNTYTKRDILTATTEVGSEPTTIGPIEVKSFEVDSVEITTKRIERHKTSRHSLRSHTKQPPTPLTTLKPTTQSNNIKVKKGKERFTVVNNNNKHVTFNDKALYGPMLVQENKPANYFPVDDDMEPEITDPKLFNAIKAKFMKPNEEYKVWEILPGTSPFVVASTTSRMPVTYYKIGQDGEIKSKLRNGDQNRDRIQNRDEESPYFPPVHDYSPNNAYLNPYNRLGLNAPANGEETSVKDINNGYSTFVDGRVKDFMEEGRKLNNYRNHASVLSESSNYEEEVEDKDHFAMDYYFGKKKKADIDVLSELLKSRPPKRGGKNKGRNLNRFENANSNEALHPSQFYNNNLKDHITAIRNYLAEHYAPVKVNRKPIVKVNNENHFNFLRSLPNDETNVEIKLIPGECAPFNCIREEIYVAPRSAGFQVDQRENVTSKVKSVVDKLTITTLVEDPIKPLRTLSGEVEVAKEVVTQKVEETKIEVKEVVQDKVLDAAGGGNGGEGGGEGGGNGGGGGEGGGEGGGGSGGAGGGGGGGGGGSGGASGGGGGGEGEAGGEGAAGGEGGGAEGGGEGEGGVGGEGQEEEEESEMVKQIKLIANILEPADSIPIILMLQKDMKRSGVSQVGSIEVYIDEMEKMLLNDDRGLKQYDWLGTTVDIQNELRKLISLVETFQSGTDLSPEELQQLYYVVHLYYAVKPKLDEFKIPGVEDSSDAIKADNPNAFVDLNVKSASLLQERFDVDKYKPATMKSYFKLDDYSNLKNVQDNGRENADINAPLVQRVMTVDDLDISNRDSKLIDSLIHKKPVYEEADLAKIINKRLKAKPVRLIDTYQKKLKGITNDRSTEIKNMHDTYPYIAKPFKVPKEKKLSLGNNRNKFYNLPVNILNMGEMAQYPKAVQSIRNRADLRARAQRKRKRGRISINKHRNTRRLVTDVSPLVPVISEPQSFEDNLKKFKVFLVKIQDDLDDLHDALKHIVMVSKRNRPFYENLKDLYLSQVTRKAATEVLLHLASARLFTLIKSSMSEVKNYIDYIENNNNDEKLKSVQDELLFVLKLVERLDELKSS